MSKTVQREYIYRTDVTWLRFKRDISDFKISDVCALTVFKYFNMDMNTFFMFSFQLCHIYNATICITKMNHHHILHRLSLLPNRISGVMVNMLASSEVDRGFEPRVR